MPKTSSSGVQDEVRFPRMSVTRRGLGRRLAGALAVAGLAFVPFLSAAAQEIYGRIWESGKKSPMQGAEVRSDCARDPDRPAEADRYGFYRLFVREIRVNCQLWISFRGQSSSRLGVYVSSGRTLADIEARRSGSSWLLIRR